MADTSGFKVKKKLNLQPTTTAGTAEGDVRADSSANTLRYHDGTLERTMVDTATAQTLTNKSIDSDNNTITNIVNADIKAAAAIAYSKLNLTGGIVNADVNASAAVARSKMANGTADYVVINSGTGAFSEEATLAVSRGGTNGATATAGFDNLSPTTTKGDVIVSDGTNNVRRAIGSDGQVLTADSAETDGVKWATPASAPDPSGPGFENISLNSSVASSACTITLKSADGTSLSAGNPGKITFRSSTNGTGTAITRSITADVSITIPSGATLGHGDATNMPIFIYAIDNAGTVELAVSSHKRQTDLIDTSTAIAATSDDWLLYSTTARSNVSISLIGHAISNQTTAGDWQAVPTVLKLAGHGDIYTTDGDASWFKGATSSAKTITAALDNDWLNITGASVTLGPGLWELHGSAYYDANSDSALRIIIEWNSANGGDNSTPPADLSAGSGVNAVFGQPQMIVNVDASGLQADQLLPANSIFLELKAEQEVFLGFNVNLAGSPTGDGDVTTYITANRVQI